MRPGSSGLLARRLSLVSLGRLIAQFLHFGRCRFELHPRLYAFPTQNGQASSASCRLTACRGCSRSRCHHEADRSRPVRTRMLPARHVVTRTARGEGPGRQAWDVAWIGVASCPGSPGRGSSPVAKLRGQLARRDRRHGRVGQWARLRRCVLSFLLRSTSMTRRLALTGMLIRDRRPKEGSIGAGPLPPGATPARGCADRTERSCCRGTDRGRGSPHGPTRRGMCRCSSGPIRWELRLADRRRHIRPGGPGQGVLLVLGDPPFGVWRNVGPEND
jgi:hypothetical protein